MYKKTIGNLTYAVYDDHAAVTACNKKTSSVVVSTEVEGKPVTEIGRWTFEKCTSLKEITIPDSVTDIGNFAFRICTSLQSIAIPNAVTKIGVTTFCGCESLESITIPDNIKKIDKTAFENCPNIQRVQFSQALTNRTDSNKIFEQMVNAGLCTYEVIFKEPAL